MSAALTPALNADYGRNSGGVVNAVTKSGANSENDRLQTLVDDYRTKTPGGIGAKVLPVKISFPAIGPSLFLVSELTGENKAPAIELSYQREKKEGRQ